MYTRGHEPWRPSLNSAYYFTSVRKPLLIPKFFSSCAPAAHSVYFLWDGSRPDILVPAQGCQGLLTLSSLAPKPFSIPMEKQQLDFDTSGMSSSPVDQPISFLLQQSSFWKSCFEAFPLMCAEGRDYWGACMDTDIVVSCDFLGKWSSHARKVLLWWELSMLWEKKKESCHFKAGNGLVALSLTDPMLLPFPSPHLGTSSDRDPNTSLLRKRR